MSDVISVRPQPAQDELILGRDSDELTSFILQVHDKMSPRLLERLQHMLDGLGVPSNLVVLEPLDEFLPTEAVADDPRDELASPRELESNQQVIREAKARGEARLVEWTKDGTLVEGKDLNEAWGITRQALDKARERGDIFSVRVGGQHYYPVEAKQFHRSDLAQIVRALAPSSPTSKLVFIKRKHGGLGGRTPLEAVDRGMLDDVLRLANAWKFI